MSTMAVCHYYSKQALSWWKIELYRHLCVYKVAYGDQSFSREAFNSRGVRKVYTQKHYYSSLIGLLYWLFATMVSNYTADRPLATLL